jgi:hypothetical protein
MSNSAPAGRQESLRTKSAAWVSSPASLFTPDSSSSMTLSP